MPPLIFLLHVFAATPLFTLLFALFCRHAAAIDYAD